MKHKDEILTKLADLWSHAGDARDNKTAVDCDWLQAELLKIRELVEKE